MQQTNTCLAGEQRFSSCCSVQLPNAQILKVGTSRICRTWVVFHLFQLWNTTGIRMLFTGGDLLFGRHMLCCSAAPSPSRQGLGRGGEDPKPLVTSGKTLAESCEKGKMCANGYGWIPIDTFLVGWTSIYQLFWGSLGTRVLTHPQICVFLLLWIAPSVLFLSS